MKHTAKGGLSPVPKEILDKIVDKANKDEPLQLTVKETKEVAKAIQ